MIWIKNVCIRSFICSSSIAAFTAVEGGRHSFVLAVPFVFLGAVSRNRPCAYVWGKYCWNKPRYTRKHSN